MEARSTHIVLRNNTPEDLTLTSVDLPHGEWSSDTSQPPLNFGPDAASEWMSESNGIATGTEGTVVFAIGGGGATLRLDWDNPYREGEFPRSGYAESLFIALRQLNPQDAGVLDAAFAAFDEMGPAIMGQRDARG